MEVAQADENNGDMTWCFIYNNCWRPTSISDTAQNFSLFGKIHELVKLS